MVSLACGKLVGSSPLAETDVFRLVAELKPRKFTGLLFLTTRGEHGFEEAALFVDSGSAVACEYEYYAFSRKFFGKDAFARFANACAASAGVVELFACEPDEMHSALAESQAALYSPRESEFVKPLKRGFSFEEELKSSATQKQSFLKKIGFKGI